MQSMLKLVYFPPIPSGVEGRSSKKRMCWGSGVRLTMAHGVQPRYGVYGQVLARPQDLIRRNFNVCTFEGTHDTLPDCCLTTYRMSGYLHTGVVRRGTL